MTDQADTGPIALPPPAGVKAGCFGNTLITDEHAFIDWAFQMRGLAAALADEVRALRAENERLRLPETAAQAAVEMAVRSSVSPETALNLLHATSGLIAARDSALAELAAARDQIAAVAALAERLRTKTPRAAARTMAGFDAVLQEHDEWVADQIAAALSQSGQPTKGASE